MSNQILLAVLPRWNLMLKKVLAAAQHFGAVQYPYRAELKNLKTLKVNSKKLIILDLESVTEIMSLLELKELVPVGKQQQLIGRGFSSFRDVEAFIAKELVAPHNQSFFFKTLRNFKEKVVVSPVCSLAELQTIEGFNILPITRQDERFKDFDKIKELCGRGLILDPWVRESDIVSILKQEFPDL